MVAPAPTRYSLVAIVLHWLIALLLVSMVFYGWWMEDLRYAAINGEVGFGFVQGAYNWHKTVGIAILILSLARLGWRLTHPAPALPSGMKPWEKQIAKAMHIAFYAVMIGAPLGGWVTASASGLPSKLFNTDLLLPDLPVPQTEGFAEITGSLHGAAGWVILVLLALHVGAALKHHFINRDGVLARMLPGLNIPSQNS